MLKKYLGSPIAQVIHIDTSSDQTARITSVNRDNYTIHGIHGEIQAEVAGKLLYTTDSPLDYPVTGDWVKVEYFNDNTFAIIQEILPRKTLLKRKEAGKNIEYQPIAANIDIAIIMQSLDRDLSPRRMERYLAMILDSKIEPVILLNKSDLMHSDQLEIISNNIQKIAGKYPIIFVSMMNLTGFDEIKKLFQKDKTYCLMGSSGVGKTTLLNQLLGKEVFETQSVREQDSRGRHTTTRRQLIQLPNGSFIIDTPGMRELGNFGMTEGLEETFEDILSLAQHCRFKDCSHTHETGCAILKAIENEEIDKKRYDNYIKMQKESAYYNRSYLEKRNKDKAFGKMVKSIMKGKTKS